MTDNPLHTAHLRDWAFGLAEHVSLLSKDPSTKVGAAIFDPKRRVVSTGYNGFARGVEDSRERLEERETKYKLTLHAEANAIMFATTPLDGCTLVVTHPCCANCAALIIQAGIKHVVWPHPSREFLMRWKDNLALSIDQFIEAGVEVHEVLR